MSGPGVYNATLTATGGQAAGEISAREGQAQGYAGTYNATLTARDNASSVIRRAIGALTGFRSRTITLTTRRVTQLVGGPREHGGISFADGGIGSYHQAGDIAFVARPGLAADPGRADIFTAATPYRFFAEPPTGWESFIPGAGDPLRNRLIWEKTGRMLGLMAHGGIAHAYQTGGLAGGTQISNRNGDQIIVDFNPVVDVDVVTGSNASASDIGREVATQVRAELDAQARDLLNTPRRL